MESFSVNPGYLPADKLEQSLRDFVQSEQWVHDNGKPLDGDALAIFEQGLALVVNEAPAYVIDKSERAVVDSSVAEPEYVTVTTQVVRVIIAGNKSDDEWSLSLYVAKK